MFPSTRYFSKYVPRTLKTNVFPNVRYFSSNLSVGSGLNEQVTAVLGSQWGDEGKGKLVDILAQNYDICARFNGGSNAGHTLVVDGKKFAMHLLPCGVLNKHCMNIIGNGVVVHVPTLLDELQMLLNAGISYDKRVKISDRAHIVFDFHQTLDGVLEQQRESSKGTSVSSGSIGTTRRGIGPTYSSKMLRNGIRMGELKNWDTFKEKYLRLVEMNQKAFNFEYNAKEELKRFEDYKNILIPMIDNTIYYINEQYDFGKRILLEAANACMLDIDFGTYPMVTSSSTTIGGVSTGLGLASSKIDNRIGIVKAYTTRVGHGPFPTELTNEIGKHIGDVGKEYGTTTGRRRRCGWIDIPLLQYSHMINDYQSINITKLDVLDNLDEIKIGICYKLNGHVLPRGYMPSNLEELAQITVEYESLPGWKTNIASCKNYNDLPNAAKKYLERIEELLHIPVSWIGVGPGRKDMVTKGFDWQSE